MRLDLQLTDSVLDLVENGIDVAIRIAVLRDSQLTVLRLAPNPLLLVVSPDYLAARGHPRTLADLSEHDCLTRTGGATWTFEDPRGRRQQVTVRGRYAGNSNEALREAALSGLGIGLHSGWDVQDHVSNGSLVELELEAVRPAELSVWAVWPGPRSAAGPKVRAFLDLLSAAIGHWRH